MRIRAHLGLMLIGALLIPATVCAHPRGSSADDGGYSIRVENEWGHQLPTFHKSGQTYVLGGLGDRYNLRVRNHSGRRVEAVITVDGRDVVSGSVGDYSNQRGYLIDAYGEVVVEGFRQNFQEVAAFRFSNPGDSYSSRMGTPQNVGVVGVAIFPERPRPRPASKPIARTAPRYEPRHDYDYSYEGGSRRMKSEGRSSPAAESAAAPPSPSDDLMGNGSGSASSAPKASRSRGASADSSYEYEAPSSYAPAPSTDNLGTKYGESVGSAAREVAFVRASPKSPSAVLTVRYDDEPGLVARGIELYPRRPVAHASPDPFPRNRFAPPPP
jgi:hypothetical protein